MSRRNTSGCMQADSNVPPISFFCHDADADCNFYSRVTNSGSHRPQINGRRWYSQTSFRAGGWVGVNEKWSPDQPRGFRKLAIVTRCRGENHVFLVDYIDQLVPGMLLQVFGKLAHILRNRSGWEQYQVTFHDQGKSCNVEITWQYHSGLAMAELKSKGPRCFPRNALFVGTRAI